MQHNATQVVAAVSPKCLSGGQSGSWHPGTSGYCLDGTWKWVEKGGEHITNDYLDLLGKGKVDSIPARSTAIIRR
jgi:hypothetical protein